MIIVVVMKAMVIMVIIKEDDYEKQRPYSKGNINCVNN